jgi:hypothetical protein
MSKDLNVLPLLKVPSVQTCGQSQKTLLLQNKLSKIFFFLEQGTLTEQERSLQLTSSFIFLVL